MPVVLCFLSVRVHFATEPLPPPYYEYRAWGTVICGSITDKSDYALQLYGCSVQYQADYIPIPGMHTGAERAVALTDSTGYYSIQTTSYIEYDSLRTGIVFPERPTIFSETHAVKESRYLEATEMFSSCESGGCSSCGTADPTEERVVRYVYTMNDTAV